MTREEIVDFFVRRQDAVDRHDAEAMAAFHTVDGVVESQIAGTVKGRDDIADVYRTWFKAFPDVAMTRDDLVIDGDRAVLVNNVAGTDTGGFMGLAPSGRAFKVAILHIFTLRDGAITHERRIYDFTGLLVQIGVLKARPA